MKLTSRDSNRQSEGAFIAWLMMVEGVMAGGVSASI